VRVGACTFHDGSADRTLKRRKTEDTTAVVLQKELQHAAAQSAFPVVQEEVQALPAYILPPTSVASPHDVGIALRAHNNSSDRGAAFVSVCVPRCAGVRPLLLLSFCAENAYPSAPTRI